MQQYEWKRDDQGNRIYDYSQSELNRRKTYLLRKIDPISEASYKDIEELLKNGGKQIVCWGAGAGKTTALRQFITRNWEEGVVYAAKTIDEVEAFAYDIASMIGEQNVFYLHSKCYQYKAYENDPGILTEYPVVVTTHERLILDPPTNFTKIVPVFQPLPAYFRYPGRKYVFVDENPNFFKRIELTEDDLALFYAVTQGESDIDRALNNIHNWLNSENTRLNYSSEHLCEIFTEMKKDSILRYVRYFHYSSVILKTLQEDTYLEDKKKVKIEISGKKIEEKLVKFYRFYYHISLFDVPYILVFDGTGDLTNRNSKYFMLNTPPKFAYRFIGKATRYENKMESRNLDSGPLTSEEKQLAIKTCIHEFILPTIEDLADRHDKLLVITWRDFKEKKETLLDTEEPPGGVARSDKLSPEKDLVDDLERNLDERGITNVVLTYYQSGKTRATSEFSDCDAVFFIGSFYIPNYAIAEYNDVNKTDITAHTYSMAEIIQGIYRTKIRHDEPVSVYFTGDWAPEFIEDCLQHMNAKTESGELLTAMDDVTWLRIQLTPAPRSMKTFDLIATKATDLRYLGKAEYILEAPSSGGQPYGDIRKYAKRLCRGHFDVSGKKNRMFLERIGEDENAPN